MPEILSRILINALYIIALINPISKVSMVSVFVNDKKHEEINFLTSKASFVAVLLLLGAMVSGDFLLRTAFKVDIYSLSLAGGIIFFTMGFNALKNGVFFSQKMSDRFSEIALVPLACPMIAGPATIAASIGMRAKDGLLITTAAIILAVFVNYVAMRFSKIISSILSRFNVMGAIIRLTGLIVMTIGVQMFLDSVGIWWDTLSH